MKKEIVRIKLNKIIPNTNQPRLDFYDDSIKGLAESIRQNGLLQPVTVRKKGDKYELIAGERRYRACLLNGAKDIEAIVKPCGLGHSKARDISACMRVLHEQYDDQVPDTMEELLALPGVGRKSANLILGDVYGKPAIVTDTHCIRLCNLIGLVDGIKEPAKVERALWKIIPPEEGNDLCHRFVLHGRAVCVARRPQCGNCCLRTICRYAAETETK